LGNCPAAFSPAVIRLDVHGIPRGAHYNKAIPPASPDPLLMTDLTCQYRSTFAGIVGVLAIILASPAAENDPRSKSHWAFQPIANPPVPSAADTLNTIDAFLSARLQSHGLTMSPPADKRTLLRRVYFDLIGLPPTFADVQAFERDDSPGAFEKVVDRLLASPRYGERWGRHWLDVARYADTKDGVLMYGDDRMRPYAFTFRDYVIRSFNEDLPFNRFIHEQLAADLIEPKVEPPQLAALGFLTLGRMFDDNIHDVIDDRIDTVSRGLLGLTVSCARCHDHKFDPIPTADYYSLYGVLSACAEPLVRPLLDPAQRGPAEYEKKFAAKVQEIEKMLDEQHVHLLKETRELTPDYFARIVAALSDPMETAQFFFSYDPRQIRPPMTGRWRKLLDRRITADDPVFAPWHALLELPESDLSHRAKQTLDSLHQSTNQLVLDALRAATLTTKVDVARTYGQLLVQVWQRSMKVAGPPTEDEQPLLDLLVGRDSPTSFTRSATRRMMARADIDKFNQMLLDLDKMAVKERAAPPRAMAVVDTPERDEPFIFVRGNPARRGAQVPRQFVRVISTEPRKPFEHGSGRLDLAHAITAVDNPLTSRVIVNRVWMHHFGEPLVDTPNDFGLRTAPPLQAELLDHLAFAFRADGWSLKKLHRHIILSAAYRQSSADRPECRKIDPENKLWWRMNRRRLDWEPMRDSMLAVSGRLETTLYGRPADIAGDPANRRRTVYGLVDRQSLPGSFRAFDFACPDQSVEKRVRTTVPQQALFGLNNPFVLEQAKALAGRGDGDDPERRLSQLYRFVLQREPTPDEVTMARNFIAGQTATPWEQFAQVLLLTNEFLFVD
jgi:Protein of unknown function (DUF1553)/Protein of unknown function (DUF1549)